MMLSAHDIEKKYRDIPALTDISFDVNRGELFGFIGPDGAGKTSLFRILTTLILPDSGIASIDGLDVVKDFKKIRRIVGYMPENFSLYGDLSVSENLEFFATVFGTSIKENYHLIQDIYLQIEPFKNRLAGRLSGGMKQKLALSCALIHQPKVLILDEPTTGVDAVSRHEFWNLLLGLKEKGITILVSTPYMDEAGMCDRVALIQKGKLLAVNKPVDIVHDFTKDIYAVRSSNLYQLLVDLREYSNTESVFPFGQELHYSDITDHAKPDEILKFLTCKGHQKVDFQKIQPGIEDVFMYLMDKGDSHAQ